MKPATNVMMFVFVNVLVTGMTTPCTAQAQSEKSKHPVGQSQSRASTKIPANKNTQWAADPELGWVRSDGRREVNDQSNGSTRRTRSKAKANDKGNKF